jgi:hypothetical protein
MVLALPPQLLNHAPTILKRPLTLHIPQRIPFDLLIRRLLLENVDENGIGGIGAYSVDDGEREFSLGKVFAEPLEGGVS